MIVKVVLAVCLLQMALGQMDQMGVDEMGQMAQEFEQMMQGGGAESQQSSGEEQQEHYVGDADRCQSKEDVMKKKFQMFKALEEIREAKEKKEKMAKMEKKLEMMSKFKALMELEEKKSQMEEMEKKKAIYELWQKQQALAKKKEEAEKFEELVSSFKEQKERFVLQLTTQFLSLCQCGEVSAQMAKMFMAGSGSRADMMEDMVEVEVMEAMQSGNMPLLAEKLQAMSPEQQKKMYMGGLIKSMCGGAKAFVVEAQKFELNYMLNANNGTVADFANNGTTAGPSN